MDSEAMAMFFALLLLGGAAGVTISLTQSTSRAALGHAGLPLAAIVALGATAGSLYFSEIANFVPCELCWFQRIAMYPLAVVLPMAAIRHDASVLRYAQVLAGIGLIIALYHSQLQAFPEQGSFCEVANPCTASPLKAFGLMTIPNMSALSFAAIVVLTSLAPSTPDKELPQ